MFFNINFETDTKKKLCLLQFSKTDAIQNLYIYIYIFFLTNTLQQLQQLYLRLLIMIATVCNILHIRCIDYNIPAPFLYLLRLI